MNRPSRWLWRIAMVSFGASLIFFAAPTLASVAAVSVGDLNFGWGHVLVLISAAAVYGDTRTNLQRYRDEQTRDREEQRRHREEIRTEMHEMRNEIKELWNRRG